MKNQKGFTLIEGLLLVIALTLIGGVGYYVYSQNEDDKKAETPVQQQAQEKPVQEIQKENQYLEIKELGVKIKKENLPEDITYKVLENNTDLEGNPIGPSISLISPSFDRKTKSCVPPSLGDGTILIVYKVNGTYSENSVQSNAYSDGLFKQFNGFYLEGTVGPDGGYCIDDESKRNTINQEAINIRTQIKEAFTKAEEL